MSHLPPVEARMQRNQSLPSKVGSVTHRKVRFSGNRGMLPAMDFILALACCVAASYIRIGPHESSIFQPGGTVGAFVLAFSLVIATALIGGYRPHNFQRRLYQIAELMLSSGVALLFTFFIMYVVFFGMEIQSQSRFVFVLATGGFLISTIILRAVFDNVLEPADRSKPFLFIGGDSGLRGFLTFLSNSGIDNPVESKLIQGKSKAEVSFPNSLGAKYEVIVLDDDLGLLSPDLVAPLMRLHFNELPVLTMKGFAGMMRRQAPFLNIDTDWVFGGSLGLRASSPYRYVKRLTETLLVSIVFLAALPLMLLIAIAIKVDSPGPVFFHQRRVGREGRIFKIHKFRTMVIGADKKGAYTAENDPRITRLGGLLRRLRLDELPQIINILRGDMSLIGPRPEWDRLVVEYEKKIPYYHLRHLVKPGLTGWAQVNFRYAASVDDAVEKLRYDLYYIEYYSPALDLEILMKTVLRVLFMAGR